LYARPLRQEFEQCQRVFPSAESHEHLIAILYKTKLVNRLV